MKNKSSSIVKDGLTGVGIGTAVIIPGISGGTIALVLGAIDKITAAVKDLFSKRFWTNVLTLLPFLIGALAAVAGLYIPFKLALENIKFSLVCLFAGLIAGSMPVVTLEIKDKKPDFSNVLGAIVGLVISILIGVFSVIFNFSTSISGLFTDIPLFLFLLVFIIGIISASGLIVPGLSGSLILLVIGFYQSIFDLLQFKNGWKDLLLLASFAFGVLVGFILWSILMNFVLKKHRRGTIFVVIGFIIGSLFAIFYNSGMVEWYHTDHFNLLEWILGPSLALIGFALAFLFSHFAKNKQEIKNA